LLCSEFLYLVVGGIKTLAEGFGSQHILETPDLLTPQALAVIS
jgi:hypothetical protein